MFRSTRSFKLGPPPPPSSPNVTAAMKGNVAKDTEPELVFRKALREKGLSGYRLHWRNAPGRPDITYPGKKTAIFINGCFWHRCPYCNLPLPKSNRSFWEKKFALNEERDKERVRLLEEAGWKVFVFWECQVKKNVDACIEEVKVYLNSLV